MSKRWIYITPLLLTVGLGFILFTAIGKDPTKLETARLNEPMPAFALPELINAERLITERELTGKVILLNVWATWCPSCRAEHDYLVALANKGVPIIGLNYKDERPEAIKWLKRLGNPYRFNIFDPLGKLGFDLGVYGAPETYVIDQFGYIRYRHVGVVNEKLWLNTLEPLLLKLQNKKS